MTVQAWIVMTTSEKNAATLLDDEDAALGAREIGNLLANNLGYGTLVGNWVAPARLLNDPDYSRWVPTLGLLPIHVMDSDTLFPFVAPEV
jgi:hypothetical protein